MAKKKETAIPEVTAKKISVDEIQESSEAENKSTEEVVTVDEAETMEEEATDAEEPEEELREAEEEDTESFSREKESINPMEKLYERRRTHMTTSTGRKRQKRINDPIVGDEDFPKTEEELEEEELHELMMAARSIPPRILDGIITGYYKTENKDLIVTVKRYDRATKTEGSIPIKIPVEMLFVYNNKKALRMPILETLQYLENEIIARVGSHIEFCVQYVVAETREVYGNRLAALQLHGKLNYININPEEGLPNISEGMLVPAEVIAVRKDRVRVEILGAETTIHSAELSHTTLDELQREYKVGDTFNVMVSDINVYEHKAFDKMFRLIGLNASRRAALVDPNKKYFKDYKEGQIVRATIKRVNEIGAFVLLDGKVNALCDIPAMSFIGAGDECVVAIDRMDENTHRIRGRIVQIR